MCENSRILKCAVFGCDNNEKIASKCHCFPQDKEIAKKWKEALNLNEFPIELLQTKFMVCENHFNSEDYENYRECESIESELRLKPDAVPTILFSEVETDLKEDATPSQCIESAAVVLSKNWHLHPVGSDMHCSNVSTASTTGTDICILANKSQYENGSDQALMFETPPIDFTILTAPNAFHKNNRLQDLKHCQFLDDMDASTEVLLAQSNLGFNLLGESSKLRTNSECGNSAGVSGTDSDVEILISEEAIDSDWSAEAIGETGTEDTLDKDEEAKKTDEKQHMDSYIEEHFQITKDSNESTSMKGQNLESATDISIEEFSRSCSLGVEASDEVFNALSMTRTYENMSRRELVNIIVEQTQRIAHLESAVNKLVKAQSNFFKHVDGLRQELANTASCTLIMNPEGEFDAPI